MGDYSNITYLYIFVYDLVASADISISFPASYIFTTLLTGFDLDNEKFNFKSGKKLLTFCLYLCYSNIERVPIQYNFPNYTQKKVVV